MNLLSATQLRDWDTFTIQNEPISSILLMERAAEQCTKWILDHIENLSAIKIFCGKGNNGADGLAIARQLIDAGYQPKIYIIELGAKGTGDFQSNLQQLHAITTEIYFIQSINDFPQLHENDIIIDALYGSGLNRPLEGLSKQVVEKINLTNAKVIAIDVPSGMYIDSSSEDNSIIKTQTTLTFQLLKLCLLVAENAQYFGDVHVLDIGLNENFSPLSPCVYSLTTGKEATTIYRPRKPFTHKGSYGHSLLISGNTGKTGAAVLAAKACVRSGTGLVTVNIPECGNEIIQTSVPEAMTIQRSNAAISYNSFNAIGIGPGLGLDSDSMTIVQSMLNDNKQPVVIDADALNCIALNKDLLKKLSCNTILTPHPKEFDRIFGTHENDFKRIEKVITLTKEYPFIIVLKGHYTLIAHQGKGYFNTTGNAGMATAGSGDVLTGILTALFAQQYSPLHTAILGVYLHGLAGDVALSSESKESLIASDIINYLGKAFKLTADILRITGTKTITFTLIGLFIFTIPLFLTKIQNF